MELMRVGAPISPRSKCCFARLGDGPVLGNAARPHNHFRKTHRKTTARVIISSLWTHRVSIAAIRKKRIKRVILLQETRGEKPRTSPLTCIDLNDGATAASTGSVAFLNLDELHPCLLPCLFFARAPKHVVTVRCPPGSQCSLWQHVNKHPNAFGTLHARKSEER